ncbi:pentatricopeptide repeat-containing protein At5g59600-like isoform X1 [Magnolia sinica]|uniref:pentatricopeptide repeat-containing protein At5g59600-like isoform X1 n=1 Tax=Magnolia sinica TaxID=86752 RepID=UPI0026591BA7|nr:pentatricopeptide repeat-containing protein At5g59600-like isoform X1 [Magnolia sinica]
MLKPLQSLYNISDHLGCLLQSCMKWKALRPGKQIHARIFIAGIGMEIGCLNAKLVGMYAGCGDVASSRLVFEQMQKPTAFAWNWMISASAFEGDCENAIRLFARMQEAGALANRFTYSCILKACVGLLEIKKGKELHGVINKRGFDSDVSVVNALIDMYCKCGDLEAARRLFDRMPQRDVASWTCMISGYLQRGKLEQSMILFKRMKLEGPEPNEFTWNAMIAGYAQNGDSNRAFEFLAEMKKEGLEPDLVTWNAMIAGFNQNQQGVKALELLGKLLAAGCKPNSVTVAGLLPACGLIGSLRKGKQVHGLIYRRGLKLNIFTVTALIDMYSKCGSIEDARKVFKQTMTRNPAAWNAMISCYGKHGHVDASIQLFVKMQDEGVQANQVTFTCLLSACSHGGLVEKGLEIFRSMKEIYGVELSKEHYACVVDLLCRSGQLVEAYELVKKMPMEVNDSVVGAFFNGCRIHGRSDLAKELAEEILQMELWKPADFVLLSNIYAADGKWEGVEKVREVMKEKGIWKKPGCSWLEKKDGLVEFRVGKQASKSEVWSGLEIQEQGKCGYDRGFNHG